MKYMEKKNFKLSSYLNSDFVVLKLFVGTIFRENGQKSQKMAKFNVGEILYL